MVFHAIMNRRQFLQLAAAASTTAALPPAAPAASGAKRRRLIVDADTANEIDDAFALARALIEPRFQIEGITSAQWHTQDEAPPDTVGPSQRLNEELLRVMKKTDVPHPRGANIPLVSPLRPQPSEAARHIIRKALETPEGEKLSVAILGPCTNVASAVLFEPAIVPRVSCHFIGLRYDHRQKLWSRDEFNTNNDPNALDVLLNTPGLEFHLMTATASQGLVFEKADVEHRWKGKGGVADLLVGIWEDYRRAWQERVSPTKATWTMWDIALIEALARPELAKAVTVYPPPENRRRPISVWVEIDVNAMREDFWQTFERWMREQR
jgi:inosine-uridine nucleoside N-ribohydrolase